MQLHDFKSSTPALFRKVCSFDDAVSHGGHQGTASGSFVPVTIRPHLYHIAGVLTGAQNTIGENFGGPAQKLSTHQFSLDDVPDLSGKVAVVTGGSEGIGFGCTYTLLKHNISKLYILSVSEEVVKGAKGAIAKDLGQEAADKTHWIQCDLSDWKRAKDVAEQIKKENDRLDILINNAARGIMTYQLTDYGVDRHMAVNHMGHVVFTSHLLPLMKKTAEQGNVVRISNQSSNAHQAAPSDTKFENLDELNRDLGPNGQYGRSKLAGVSVAHYFEILFISCDISPIRLIAWLQMADSLHK